MDGNVRLYDDDKTLLHTLDTQEPIAALRFGPFAREEGSLAVVSVSGKLSIFMLNRKAVLGKPSGSGGAVMPAGRPPEQDIPLKVKCTVMRHFSFSFSRAICDRKRVTASGACVGTKS